MTYEEARTKVAEMIYDRVISINDFHKEVTKIYAQSCCENFRTKCAKELPNSFEGNLSVSDYKDSILNTPITLP